MDLPDTPFTQIDWNNVPVREYRGTTGTSHWRVFTSGDMRVRIVDYGPGYLADHWCNVGHVLHVLAGELAVELADGRAFLIPCGGSFCVSDHGDSAHRVRTDAGCQVFIVD